MADDKDALLDDLLATARAQRTAPGDDLVARVLADADAHLTVAAAASPPRPQSSRWAAMLDALGGWPALGGLTAAGMAGLWLGVVPPAPVEAFAAQLLGTSESIALFPEIALGALDEGLSDG